jgi:hypothetical protein
MSIADFIQSKDGIASTGWTLFMVTEIISEKFRELFANHFQPRNAMLRHEITSQAFISTSITK